MKKMHALLISIAASFGFTVLLISFVSIFETIKVHLGLQTFTGIWSTYLDHFNRYEANEFYYFAIIFIFLFLVLQIKKDNLHVR